MQNSLTHHELWVTEKTQISRDLRICCFQAEVFDVLRTSPAGPSREAEDETDRVRTGSRGDAWTLNWGSRGGQHVRSDGLSWSIQGWDT